MKKGSAYLYQLGRPGMSGNCGPRPDLSSPGFSSITSGSPICWDCVLVYGVPETQVSF